VPPLPPVHIFGGAFRAEEHTTATEHPSDKAGLPPDKDPLTGWSALSLVLRNLNNATSVKTPPFSWLYGGDTEGATNPTS
jgi:hypothetical protein